MKFNYILITLLLAAIVMVVVLNPIGRTIVFDGKSPDTQTYFTPELTPRTWMANVPEVWQGGNGTTTPVLGCTGYCNDIIRRSHQIGTGISTPPSLRCFKFVNDTYCQ